MRRGSIQLQNHWGTLERNKAFVELYKDDKGYADIARMFKLSRQRVREIIMRELNNGRTNQADAE